MDSSIKTNQETKETNKQNLVKTAHGVVAEKIKNKMCYAKAGLMGATCQIASSSSEYIYLKIIACYRFPSIVIDFVNR